MISFCNSVRLNVPVNNFSVMSGQSHHFLGITSTFREQRSEVFVNFFFFFWGGGGGGGGSGRGEGVGGHRVDVNKELKFL